MPLPVGLTTITVTGTYTDAAGDPLNGSVTFTPNADLVDSAGSVILRAEPITVRVVAGSMAAVTLVCTDNGAISPSGWAWEVSEYIGGTGQNLPARTYAVLLPHTLGATVDLSALVPVSPSTPVSTLYGVLGTGYTNTWQSSQAFESPVDIAGSLTLGAMPVQTSPGGTTEFLRADGNWAAPPGSGGGAVTSVNNETGAVVLAATDVGAIPTTAAGANSGVATLDSSGHLTGSQAANLLAVGNDLSELTSSAATARQNLGLGSAAIASAASFDTAGSASAAQAAAQSFATSAVGTETARAEAAEGTKLTASNNLSDVASASLAFGNIKQNATTGATGVVQFDGTASDIQPIGVAAAGSSGLAADAKHVHPGNPWQFPITNYGAKGDGQAVVDGAITTSTNTLACTTSTPFKPGDVGKAIMVKGAGAANVTTLVTTISSYTDSGHVTLAANASTTVASGGLVLWATDDTSAIQQAVNAAMTYAQAHGQYSEVVVPSPTGLFYGVAGPLVNTVNASTLWNSQITLPAISDRSPKVTLAIKGAGNSGTTRHWNQNYPAFNPSTLVSFGVFASQSAQSTSVTNGGNPSVIGGPTGKFGYGGAGQLFSNVLISLQDLTILTTHSSSGYTYSAVNLWGCATAGLSNFSCSTTGMVELYGGTNDYGSGSTFGGGASIGILLPGSGNNADVQLVHVTIGGGYTYGIYATEHTTAKGLTILYCWSGLCPVGLYNDGGSGIGGQHGIYVDQCCIEACLYHINMVGVGTVGPTLHAVLDTEGTVNFRDTTSGTSLAAANGEVRMIGTSSSPTLTASTGLRIIREQIASGVAGAPPTLTANTAVCNTLYRPATAYLTGGTSLTTIQVSALAGGASAPAVTTVADFTAAGTIAVPFPVRVGPGQWIKINTSAGTAIPTAVWVLD